MRVTFKQPRHFDGEDRKKNSTHEFDDKLREHWHMIAMVNAGVAVIDGEEPQTANVMSFQDSVKSSIAKKAAAAKKKSAIDKMKATKADKSKKASGQSGAGA